MSTYFQLADLLYNWAMQAFQTFGPSHRIVLLLLAAAVSIVLWKADRRFVSTDARLRYGYACFLLANELFGLWVGYARGEGRIPLQLCDLVVFLTFWCLIRPRPWRCQLAYFWALSGSLQAILTPDLHADFPDYWWIKFFASHGGVVLAAVYLARTGRVRPSAGTVVWVWLATNVYVLLALGANAVLGTNYGYLSHKPAQPSVLDYLGPWPYYILGMEVLGLLLLWILYLPWAVPKESRYRQ